MNKKIYCAGPLSGDTTFAENYKWVIQIVKNNGFTPLHEQELKPNFELTDREIFLRDIKWISDSVGVIAEVSGPSLGVGFEIAYSLYVLKKPVLALYNQEVRRLSAMIKGCDSPLLSIQVYKDELELEKYIKIFLQMVLK